MVNSDPAPAGGPAPGLRLAAAIDALNAGVGRGAAWLVLAAVLLSVANALSRKFFDLSSNAFLELQWYLVSAAFMLGGAWTLQLDEHVRIDVLTARLSARARAWLDLVGLALFLLPLVLAVLWLGWPWFARALLSAEHSPSDGGLLLWPARLLVPLGFSLLALQALAEALRRIAFLRGQATRWVAHAAEKQT